MVRHNVKAAKAALPAETRKKKGTLVRASNTSGGSQKGTLVRGLHTSDRSQKATSTMSDRSHKRKRNIQGLHELRNNPNIGVQDREEVSGHLTKRRAIR